MSVGESDPDTDINAGADRRIRRTRAAIVEAFRDMVFKVRYSDIRVGDIVQKADIGRSTFYQHFTGKDDVLITSMDWVLTALASSAGSKADTDHIEEVLSHMWSHRDRGRNILAGTTGQVFAAALARKFEIVILAELEDQKVEALVPPIFVANQLAASTNSLLKSWLGGVAPAQPAALARVLTRTAQSTARAAIKD